jgi:predicted dehydrogenase
MSNITRRTFVQTTGALAMGAWARKASAADAPHAPLRHAVIGTGGQGKHHAQCFSEAPGCVVTAVCDLDPERRGVIAAKLREQGPVQETDDFHAILADPAIDSVSIATPDHWHTPIALHALQAGKHVYVEKPCSHTIEEAQALSAAVARHGKCLQHGTQSRSGEGIQKAVAFLREGKLGKVRMAKAINHQMRGPIGRAADGTPPPGVNYDRWIGSAPVRPFTENRWHYNWHWFWDYGCGDLGNDGIHQVDQARWGLGVGLPRAVSASGGQLFYDDDHETPDTQIVTFEYEDCYLLHEMRLWTDYPMEGHDNGVIFYGDKGTLQIGRRGCEVHWTGGPVESLGGGADLSAHVRNFIDCARANDPAKLNAPVHEAVTSTILCHLGNIATRVGRRLQIDPNTAACLNDPEANALYTKTYRKGYELLVG